MARAKRSWRGLARGPIKRLCRLPAEYPARLSKKLPEETPPFQSLFCVEPVLEHSVAPPPWSATARSVEAANGPAPHGRGLAPFARALRGRRATGSLLEGIRPVHGVA